MLFLCANVLTNFKAKLWRRFRGGGKAPRGLPLRHSLSLRLGQARGKLPDNLRAGSHRGSGLPTGTSRLLAPARMERQGEGAGAGRGEMAAAALRAAKAALRAELKRRLRALSAAEKLRQSRLLAGKMMQHAQYQASQRIAVFLSMPDEVQTEEIIKDIFHRGKVCFIPRYDPQSNHMDMVKLAAYEEIASLPQTSWNIHQPAENDVREEALTAPEGLDLILMPGLGFDNNGNRLGRGKGYYDAYLSKCMRHPKGKPYTIALAFKEQMCAAIPTSENDVKVDEILFEGSGH